MNYVRQTDFLELSQFHLSHNKLWRKLNRLSSEKYGSLKAGILRVLGYVMHEWLTNFEHNVNQAADIRPDSPDYQRCLFIAWPGNPENPADYLDAATTSRDYGVKVAKLCTLPSFTHKMTTF